LLTINADEIRGGLLEHLDISLDANGLHFPRNIIPSPSQGKHSKRNVNGEIIIRKDLPMENRDYSWEAPNWGDEYNGTHTIDMTREVYQREFIPPRIVSMNIDCQTPTPGLNGYAILFQLDETLNKHSQDFLDRLLDLVNILQENIYTCDVNAANLSYQGYLRTIQLAWEILPPGERDQFIQRLAGNNPNPQQSRVIEQRYAFLLSLNPTDLIIGTSGLQRYSGAKITDNLVVFENIRYGNAIYIMFDDWNTLSQRSRTEILTGNFGNNYDRVVHSDGWEARVRTIIQRRLVP
jgi:hypothetical protein